MNRKGRVGSKVVENRNFREYFGTSQNIVQILWKLLVDNDLLPENCQLKHLLWTLFFMKVYPKQAPACSGVGGSGGAVDPKTLCKWAWAFIINIAELEDIVVSVIDAKLAVLFIFVLLLVDSFFSNQIDFEQRKVGDVYNDCLMSVDGTDFQIQQKGPAVRGNRYGSHKFGGRSGLRYELGICILTSHLVWIQGPYPAGQFNDIAIFNMCLAHKLDPYERVEADNGYCGHVDKVKCPKNANNRLEKRRMQARVRARHETFNGRLKNWGILKQVFRHKVLLHGKVFRACAVITQLMVENGELLFSVEYNDT